MGKIYQLNKEYDGTVINKKSGSGSGGGQDMSKYVTKEELKRELDSLEDNLKNAITISNMETNHRVDKISPAIENQFLKFERQMKNEQSTSRKWIVGTAIALGSLLIAAMGIFF